MIGLTGCTLAERVALQRGERVVLINRRDRIGGNAQPFAPQPLHPLAIAREALGVGVDPVLLTLSSKTGKLRGGGGARIAAALGRACASRPGRIR